MFLHLLMLPLSCEGQNWASSNTSRQLASFTISAPCISQVQFLDLPVLCLLSGFHGLPSFLAKPLAVNMPVLSGFPRTLPGSSQGPTHTVMHKDKQRLCGHWSHFPDNTVIIFVTTSASTIATREAFKALLLFRPASRECTLSITFRDWLW